MVAPRERERMNSPHKLRRKFGGKLRLRAIEVARETAQAGDSHIARLCNGRYGAKRTCPIRASCVGGDGLSRRTLTLAEMIRTTERRQADEMRAGGSFRDQAAFGQYLARRAQVPAFGFREHLKLIGGAIEE